MKFTNENLQRVQHFVPEAFQRTAESFFNYLKSLPYKRQDIRFYSLATNSGGLQIIEYAQHATSVEEFTWRSLKNLILKEYLPERQNSPQYQLHLDQLKNAF